MLTTTSRLCHGFNHVMGLTHVVEHPWVHHLRHLLVQFGHLGWVHVLRHVTPWWIDTQTHTLSVHPVLGWQTPPKSPFMAQSASPLKSPLMPPIFLTIWANFVYWVSSSWTSRVATPDPRATLWILLGCLLNSLAPSLLSSSEEGQTSYTF